MAKNYLFIILPEYPDKETVTTSNVFQINELPDEKQVDKWMKQLVAFLDFFNEEECEQVYDAKNLKSCLYVLDTLKDSYPNRSLELLRAMHGYSDWRKHRISEADQSYEIYHAEVKDEVRTEVAEREMVLKGNLCMIAVHIPDYVQKDWIVKKGHQMSQVSSLPLLIPEVFDWLAHHRSQVRVYNWNPKHGEQGTGAHPVNKGNKVAILHCSKEHAQDLLQKAIGKKGWNCLWTYDAEKHMFMEFQAETKYAQLPAEAIERKYHSYHLEGSENIPKEVLKRLRMVGIITDKD